MFLCLVAYSVMLIDVTILIGYFFWVIFCRWGGGKDDKYFARMGKSAISVYETETFSLVDKKSIKVENVMDFSWSPTDSILALFVPELGGGNQPARVSSYASFYFFGSIFPYFTYMLVELMLHMIQIGESCSNP